MLRRRLGSKPFLVLDGAMGTELEFRGHQLDPQLWTAKLLQDHTDAIMGVHNEYIAAGADIITTCSYQVTHFDPAAGVSASDILRTTPSANSESSSREQLHTALRLAAESRGDVVDDARSFPLIAFSMSCIGANITHDGLAHEFHGDYATQVEASVMRDWHRARFRAVLAGDRVPEIVLFETFPVLAEIVAVCEMIQEEFALRRSEEEEGGEEDQQQCSTNPNPNPAIMISFTCASGEATCFGDPIEKCFEEIVTRFPFVSSIGVNCIKPRVALSLVRRMATTRDALLSPRSGHSVLISCHTNSGEEYDEIRKVFYWANRKSGVGQADGDLPIINEEASEGGGLLDWKKFARMLHEAGCEIIGGCCRTRPSTIRQFAELRNEMMAEERKGE